MIWVVINWPVQSCKVSLIGSDESCAKAIPAVSASAEDATKPERRPIIIVGLVMGISLKQLLEPVLNRFSPRSDRQVTQCDPTPRFLRLSNAQFGAFCQLHFVVICAFHDRVSALPVICRRHHATTNQEQKAMLTKRHSEILKILEADGTASISALAEKLGVSLETVRRDVKPLEQR